ncbi:MAG: DUF1566 domain-containing protein [SAR324 cluster bacterium]|nr:DUF1566 domain-containing protein [SAR324 cluster bacterium]
MIFLKTDLLIKITLVLIATTVITSCKSNINSTEDEDAIDSFTGTFAKLAKNGDRLENQDGSYSATGNEDDGTRWSCIEILDSNKNTWEVKTNSITADALGARNKDLKYIWYNSAATVPGTTQNTDCQYGNVCDIQKYANYLNANSLCGITNWRVPTAKELESLVTPHHSPSIDRTYFPHTFNGAYWSIDTSTKDGNKAVAVLFSQNGRLGVNSKTGASHALRLVGQKSSEN